MRLLNHAIPATLREGRACRGHLARAHEPRIPPVAAHAVAAARERTLLLAPDRDCGQPRHRAAVRDHLRLVVVRRERGRNRGVELPLLRTLHVGGHVGDGAREDIKIISELWRGEYELSPDPIPCKGVGRLERHHLHGGLRQGGNGLRFEAAETPRLAIGGEGDGDRLFRAGPVGRLLLRELIRRTPHAEKRVARNERHGWRTKRRKNRARRCEYYC